MRRLLHLYILLTLLWGLPLPVAAVPAEATSPRQKLVEVELRLIEKRMEILKMAQADAKRYEAGKDPAQRKAATLALAKYPDDLKELKARRSALRSVRDLSETPRAPAGAGRQSLSSEEKCNYQGCLKILGVMNRDLANSMADITTQVVIEDWNKFAVISEKSGEQKTSRVQSADALDEVLKFRHKSFACDRALGSAAVSVRLASKPLGSCFASVIAEVSKELGTTAKLSNGSDFAVPKGSNLPDFGSKHEKISKKIMEFPDYQMKPWELFRECAREENGSLREALHLCYEVLRYNRFRPDVSRKLLDIRGDRSTGGDNSGDWYHLFGMANMSTWFGPVTKVLYSLSPDIVMELLEGSVDRLSSANAPPDALEKRNDFIGADAGRIAKKQLEKALTTKSTLPSSEQACDLESILLNEKSQK